MTPRDLIGRRFGHLTVIESAGASASGNLTWWCRCDCGNTTRTVGTDLRLGRSETCGCGMGKRKRGEAQRLQDSIKIGAEDECWPWQLALTNDGYGRIRRDVGGKVGAHRLAWILVNGEPPPGTVFDHLCRKRSCCNPKHLEPVDTKTNLMRGETHAYRNSAKTHCIRGHKFSTKNTYRDRLGKRSCRACRRLHKKWARDRRLQAQQEGKANE